MAVQEGRKRLLAHGVPYKRPDDFFCDMLKSDEHMAKARRGDEMWWLRVVCAEQWHWRWFNR